MPVMDHEGLHGDLENGDRDADVDAVAVGAGLGLRYGVSTDPFGADLGSPEERRGERTGKKGIGSVEGKAKRLDSNADVTPVTDDFVAYSER